MVRDLLTVETDEHGYLRSIPKEVRAPEINADMFKEEIQDMIDTMEASHGLGLAANQIGIDRQIFVVRDGNDLVVAINPKYVGRSPNRITSREEGCLSCGKGRKNIRRHRQVTIEAYNRQGELFIFKPKSKITNIAVQHEMDHLKGKLILDY